MAWRISLMLSRSLLSVPHHVESAEPPCLSRIPFNLPILSLMLSSMGRSRNRAETAVSGISGMRRRAGSSLRILLMRSMEPWSMYSRNSMSSDLSALISLAASSASLSPGRNRIADSRGCQGARYTSASVITPNIPSDPMNRSTRSMSSLILGPVAFFMPVSKS